MWLLFRLEQLKTYGENEWKKRVKSTNDANEFTIEGKLRQAGIELSSLLSIESIQIFQGKLSFLLMNNPNQSQPVLVKLLH